MFDPETTIFPAGTFLARIIGITADYSLSGQPYVRVNLAIPSADGRTVVLHRPGPCIKEWEFIVAQGAAVQIKVEHRETTRTDHKGSAILLPHIMLLDILPAHILPCEALPEGEAVP